MGKVEIGLGQAKRLCQMNYDDRLVFLAEGLPIILDSARGLWDASQLLTDSPREAGILENHAEEEAAKALVVMDMIRCPKKLCASKMGKLTKWFYDHLARLLYANAVNWRPSHLSQLREYVDRERVAHYLEGHCGEFIAPNFELWSREGRLYADIEAYESGEAGWHAPITSSFQSRFDRTPPALRLAESLSTLGLFSIDGVREVAQMWDQVEFKDIQGPQETRELSRALLESIIGKNLTSDSAEQKDVDKLYDWQMPMYNLEFDLIHVPLEKLNKARDAMLWAESGY